MFPFELRFQLSGTWSGPLVQILKYISKYNFFWIWLYMYCVFFSTWSRKIGMFLSFFAFLSIGMSRKLQIQFTKLHIGHKTCLFTLIIEPELLPYVHTWSWKFFSEGEPSKIFLGGMWGGIQMFKVLSVREIFFCFVSKFLKIKSGIYKFRLQGDMGRDAR